MSVRHRNAPGYRERARNARNRSSGERADDEESAPPERSACAHQNYVTARTQGADGVWYSENTCTNSQCRYKWDSK